MAALMPARDYPALYIVGRNALHVVDLELEAGQPLTASRIRDVGVATAAARDAGSPESKDVRTLTMLTSSLRLGYLAYRLPVAAEADRATRLLDDLARAGRQERRGDWICWLAAPLADPPNAVLLLLSDDQASTLRWTAPSPAVIAASGQTLSVPWLAEDGVASPASSDSRLTPPYLVHALLNEEDALSGLFQLYPINEMPRSLWHTKDPFSAVLNPIYQPKFGASFVILRNAEFEDRHPNRQARLAVPVMYDDAVPPTRAAVHETSAQAVGARPGELCCLEPTAQRASRLQRRLFAYRHAVCRVVPARTVDVGYPVARAHAELIDVLGLQAGDEVIVQGLPHEGRRRAKLRRLRLRILPDHSARRLPGPDFSAEIGEDDVPTVALDLLRRQELGLLPGSAIYLRPAFSTMILKEAVALSLVLAGALVGALSADNMVLTSIIVCIYVI
ncbi:MAG TPA: hypothetical protein VG106_06620, partial [Vicinamibacterales bacterium]|nr:hypothetical protein [Vicinamibacterales bacterium]